VGWEVGSTGIVEQPVAVDDVQPVGVLERDEVAGDVERRLQIPALLVAAMIVVTYRSVKADWTPVVVTLGIFLAGFRINGS
jgi:hypothetical protein